MAVDVVPALLDSVKLGFIGRMERDGRILRVNNRIRDGTATLIDAHTYANRVGTALSNSLAQEITIDTLPNGELYFNIADRVVNPMLHDVYDRVNYTAEDIQRILDRKKGIGLNAVHADFPKERIDGLIDRLSDQEEDMEERLKWLHEPIINNSEAFFDDYVAENASTRASLGMRTTITRLVDPGCCSWCAALAGIYEYGDEPKEVYARHEFCRCQVVYDSERGFSQNVWDKSIWSSTPEELAERRAAGIRIRG